MLIVTILIVLIAGGFGGWRHFKGTEGAPTATDRSKQDQKTAAIPVTVATVRIADFPVTLNGLGAVAPYNTVTVRSRVDGEITKVEFKQGQMVKEGDILVLIDPRPFQAALDQALAKKAQDEANLRDAQANLQRYSTLAKEDFASRQQVESQQATVNQLEAQIKGDQAAIDNAQTQLSYTTIRSPLSGKTGFRLVDPGNIVHPTDTTGIVTIVQLQPIWVIFTAPEENVPEINAALAAGNVPVSVLTADGLKTLAKGRLALINNEVDQASGTIRMKATFENVDNVLWPGLSVTTHLLVNTLKQVVVVPEDALQRGPNGLYAYVINDNNKAEMDDIKVGQEGNGQAVVVQGLSAGQRVVVAGQYRLQQGALVTAREASDQNGQDVSERTSQRPPSKAD